MADAVRLPGLRLRDHAFALPLDPDQPDGPSITVFGREVRAAAHADRELPWLVFLQGGPGFPSPRPTERGGWLKRATERHRVLLLDQRGTGCSTPVTARALAAIGGPRQQAEYLRHFRADRIVDDCEAIRTRLNPDGAPWSILGQSFGGFCATHYLSAHPEGLREAFITGGLPPLDATADAVYRKTYAVLERKNAAYFAQYPEDRGRLERLADHLDAHELRLPCGDRLSTRRLQQIGLALGMSDGFAQIHALLEMPWVAGPDGPEPSYPFLRALENFLHFDTNPLYALLHEACYTQGAASRWAAHRVRDAFPAFDPAARPLALTGEMVYPWQFEEQVELQPLRETAEILAHDEDWPLLYDAERLRANAVPVAAAVYADDLYVDRDFSLETAATIGNCRVWLTNEYEHNGLRADGERVLGHLFDLVDGER